MSVVDSLPIPYDEQMVVDIGLLRSWIGKSTVAEDVVTATPLRALAATLDLKIAPFTQEEVPPCWHWLYFLPLIRQSQIGDDGHPLKGGFLPPVPLPRRMWAGSVIEFRTSLLVGDAIERTSRIEDVQLKKGKSGPLVFVQVRHDVRANGRITVVEVQNIVYCGLPPQGAHGSKGIPTPVDPPWSRDIDLNEVMLFRYSALTFNSHRIHYDRRYAMALEGYPGLVVHGPLIATLLLELLRCQLPEARVTQFTFSAIAPIFEGAPFQVCGRQEDARNVRLWARSAEGHVSMEALATIENK